MSRWFRHYAGMARDDKMVRVALRAKQPVERVIWVWNAILESAAEIDDGGRFDLEDAEAAYFLRTDEADIVSIRVCLEAMGRIHEGIVVKWSDRQFQSDRSAERQRRYRDKRRRDTDAERHGDGEVTSPSHDADAPETDTKAEKDTSSLRSDVAREPAEKPKPSKPKVKTALPTDWTPSERNLDDAKAAGFSEADIAREIPKFRDRQLAQGARYADWDATWRNWCRRAPDFARATGPPAMANGNGSSHQGNGHGRKLSGSEQMLAELDRSRAEREGTAASDSFAGTTIDASFTRRN